MQHERIGTCGSRMGNRHQPEAPVKGGQTETVEGRSTASSTSPSSPGMYVGAATPLRLDDREDWIASLVTQIDDLKTRLDESESERRAIFDEYRNERDRLLHVIEGFLKHLGISNAYDNISDCYKNG